MMIGKSASLKSKRNVHTSKTSGLFGIKIASFAGMTLRLAGDIACAQRGVGESC